MLNNLYNLFFFPEATLLLGSLAIILIALFLKKNTFSITSNLSIILLIIVGIIIFIDKETTFLNFNKFFIESDFIKFFHLLVILGSVSTILISKNYYKDQKLTFFEIPILILFSTNQSIFSSCARPMAAATSGSRYINPKRSCLLKSGF